MGTPIKEREIARFIGTDYFKEADRIRGVSTAWGTENRDNQFADLKFRAVNKLEVTMQARGHNATGLIRKYAASLEYHLKNRAGITMPYKEICELTADRNPDGTPIL